MAKKIDVNGLDHYHDKVSAMFASEYSSSKLYAVGEYCFHAGTLYECTTPITTAENWTAGHWTAAKLADDTSALKTAINDVVIISDTEPSSESNKIWIDSTASSVQVPTMDDLYWDSAFVRKSVSGSKVIFTDGAKNVPVKSFGTANGATKVYQTSKNILPSKSGSYTTYGVTYTLNEDGSYHAEGEVNAASWNYYSVVNLEPIEKYNLSVGDKIYGSMTSDGMAYIGFFNADNTRINYISVYSSRPLTITVPEDAAKITITLYCTNLSPSVGQEIDVDIYAQFERGETATSWERGYSEEYTLTNGVSDKPVKTFLGSNIISANSGNVSLTYYCDATILYNDLQNQVTALGT